MANLSRARHIFVLVGSLGCYLSKRAEAVCVWDSKSEQIHHE